MDIDVPFTVAPEVSEEERDAIHKLWIKQLDDKTSSLVSFIEECLELKYGITKCFAVFLHSHQSGINGKYSAHVIMQMNGSQTRFKTSQDIEYFLYDILASKDPEILSLITWKQADYTFPYDVKLKAQMTALFDKNVYRRNGEFRLPFASKRQSATRYLYPAYMKGVSDEELQHLHPQATSAEERIFLSSLLTYIPKSVVVTDFLVHERTINSKKRPHALSAEDFHLGTPDGNADERFFDLLAAQINSALPEECQGALGMISAMKGVIVFSSKSTYCDIKKDFHKRNHIYWVVKLKSYLYYQRCFDEGCLLKCPPPPPPKADNGDLAGPRYWTPKAKGHDRFFNLKLCPTIFDEMNGFMARNKEKLDALIEGPDTKRARSDIRYYDKNGPRNGAAFEESALSIDMILGLILNDIDDLNF